MRDFFINALEMVIHVVVVIAAIAIVGSAIGILVTGTGGQMGMPSILAALLVLIGGGLYLILMAGFLYLGLGIYQNTKRTTALLEQLAAR